MSEQFRAKANALCTPALTQRMNQPIPYPTFDAYAPAKNAMRAEARYVTGQSATEPLLRALIALRPTEKNADKWTPIRTFFVWFRTERVKQIAAAQAQNVPAFVANAHAISKRIAAVTENLSAAGFQPADDCYTWLTG